LTATRADVHDLLELAEERTTLLVQHLGVDQWKKVEPDAHRDDQRTFNQQKTKVRACWERITIFHLLTRHDQYDEQ
jgi:hypothetical protein